jgi:hypothetical protein
VEQAALVSNDAAARERDAASSDDATDVSRVWRHDERARGAHHFQGSELDIERDGIWVGLGIMMPAPSIAQIRDDVALALGDAAGAHEVLRRGERHHGDKAERQFVSR